jgi:hypothetical protein
MNRFRRSSYNMYWGLRQKTKHVRKKLRELCRCLKTIANKLQVGMEQNKKSVLVHCEHAREHDIHGLWLLFVRVKLKQQKMMTYMMTYMAFIC